MVRGGRWDPRVVAAGGRRVDLDGEHAWLRAPIGQVSGVADGWLTAEAARRGGQVAEARLDDGLLPDMSVSTVLGSV